MDFSFSNPLKIDHALYKPIYTETVPPHNYLLVWTAWNVMSINNDGYHVISTSTGNE